MFTVSGIDRSNMEVFCRGGSFHFAEILPTAHLIALDKCQELEIQFHIILLQN